MQILTSKNINTKRVSISQNLDISSNPCVMEDKISSIHVDINQNKVGGYKLQFGYQKMGWVWTDLGLGKRARAQAHQASKPSIGALRPLAGPNEASVIGVVG
jgi:hypothetical protein